MLGCIGLVILVILLVSFASTLLPILLPILGLYIIYRIILYGLKVRYFKSEEFLKQKELIKATVDEYNEIADYAKRLPSNSTFKSTSNKGEFAHLAKYENTSDHDYKRDKNVKSLNQNNIYSTSLAVVKRASEEPIKYLCKYFDIKATEENLNQIEKIGENVSRLENAVENLDLRLEEIKNDFNPPKYILKYYEKELMEKLHVNIPSIEIEYADYIFEYVSAGGNSSQKTTVTLNGQTLEAVAKYLDEKIKYKKSAAAQRSLMTNKLRKEIKERDNYTCQNCKVSTKDQSLLLLEIDHIHPVSRGGLTTPNNLQTLCWKCNRTKSNKI